MLKRLVSTIKFGGVLAALLAGLSTAHAAVSVSASFNPSVIVFSPGATPVYIMGVGLGATGFTDDSNTDNFIRLAANNSAFSGDLYPARGTGSGTAGSTGYSTLPDLVSHINSSSSWTLTLTDGVTHTTRTYSLSVSTPGIADGYVRPITVDTPDNSPISETPTFTFTQPSTGGLPNSANTGGFAFMFGAGGAYYGSPNLQAGDNSWTPDGPLPVDRYSLDITKLNDSPPQTLVHATTPAPIGGVPALASFSQSVHIQSDASVNGLTVGNPDAPAVDVTVEFTPAVLSFAPTDPPTMILGIGINASGFVDDSNNNNFISLVSSDHNFSGDYYPARGTGSGTAGSAGFDSAASLSAAINAVPSWTLTVTDGTTGSTRTLSASVTTPGIPTDYLRPISLATVGGSDISAHPTFPFSQPSTNIPAAQNTSGFAFMIGNLPNNYATSPPLLANDTSWAPDTALIPDTYSVTIAKRDDSPDQTLLHAPTPTPPAGVAPLSSFSFHISIQCEVDRFNLLVRSTCTADFNGDGDIGTDADIEAFFACLSGNCCPLCGSADFNGDGDVGTDADIESFFRVLAGGSC